MTRPIAGGALCVLMLAIAGCSNEPDADLASFVAKAQQQTAPPIEQVPEIAAYQPYQYDVAGRRSPFQPPRPERQPVDSGVRPDVNRPLEPLEQFPLDALTLVGSLTSNGVTYALIRAPDGVVHRAPPGTHLGRNYGEIQRVDATSVMLAEIVPDGDGGYRRRDTTLTAPTDRSP